MRRSPRLIGTVGLLVLALVVAAVLAYQAWDAAASQRRTAESTLHDYAKLVDWQLTQQAKNALLTQVVTSLSRQASHINPDSLAQTVMPPSEVWARVDLVRSGALLVPPWAATPWQATQPRSL